MDNEPATIKGAEATTPGSRPSLSVIVPVFNSSADLAQCLSALTRSDADAFEVIVVDDGSTEPIEPVVAEHGFRYMRISGPRGPARARNRGVARASGTHVAFVDADVCVHADTVRRMAERFAGDPSIDAVIGTYDDKPADSGFFSQYKNIFHHYVHQDSDGDVSTFWSGCGAIRKNLFEAFGGFDEVRYARPAIEDIELGTWLSAAGHRIVLDRHILCTHLKRWTFGNLLKTDIFDRGIPWTRLMLRARNVPSTLNVKPTQRISVALAYLTIAAAATGFLYAPLWIAAAAGATAVTLLNWDFYRYFLQRRGLLFLVRMIPLHWLYFGYCGVSVGVGTFLHYWKREPEAQRPVAVELGADRPAG